MAHAKPQFLILLLLVSFGSVGAVLFTPALPEIQAFFGITVGEAQLTVTSYLIGYALGQLPYGPLANRFGRKPTLYIGIAVAIISSLFCAFSAPLHSFWLLVIARFFQALGACVGLKISFTMIADAYDQVEATKMVSRITISFAILPGIGIAIGGWLTQAFDWESCFYFLALFGAVAIWVCTFLPETAKSLDKTALHIRSMMKGYALKLKNARLMTCALMMGCGTAVVYVFAAKAPFIGIKGMGLSPEIFGSLNLIPPIGMLAGSLLSIRLAGRFPLYKLLLVSILISLAATFTQLIPFAFAAPSVWSLFFPMLLIYASEAIVYANVISLGLASAKNKSNASAVLNFVNMSTAVAAVLLSGVIYPESALIMPVSFSLFFVVMLGLWARLRKL